MPPSALVWPGFARNTRSATPTPPVSTPRLSLPTRSERTAIATTPPASRRCVAALAGCGQGADAAKLDEKERARLRRQALDWLRADLTAWGKLLDKQPEKARAAVQQALRHWQEDSDLAGVRGDGLTRLPEAELQPWQQLWVDVERMLK
jgi:hypothetical protein